MGDGNICKIYFCFNAFVFSNFSAKRMFKFYSQKKHYFKHTSHNIYSYYTAKFYIMMKLQEHYISTDFKNKKQRAWVAELTGF